MTSVRPSRRQLLRAAAGAFATPLAGCADGRSPSDDPTVTPAPVPDRSVGPTAAMAPPTARPPTPDEFALDVSVQQGFSPDHPARLERAFTNVADRPLLGLDGPAFVLPFVDDDYVGESDAGAHELFLVPDEANLAVQPEGADLGWVDEFLSDEPTDGCWTLPFDWPDAAGVSTAILNAVRLAPGETVRHG